MKIQRRQNRNQGGLAFRFMKGLVNFLGVIASGAIRDLWRYSCYQLVYQWAWSCCLKASKESLD